jgi:LysM repeat protein
MRNNFRHARWLVLALILAAALTGCYRSAGGSLEPTPSNVNVTQVANNTPIPMPSFTPVPAETEEATEEVIEPTSEEMTELPSPVAASPTSDEPVPTQPEEAAAVPTQEEAALPGGPTGPTPTLTAVPVVIAPTFTTVPPTQVVAVVPSATPTVALPTPVPTEPPTLLPTQPPALVVPAGPTATFTSVPFNRPAPSATYTPFVPPQEAQPLGERPTDTLVPVPDGQGGPLPTETPAAVAQAPTLTTNQMTATAIIAGATATMAAIQGTIVATQQPAPGQVTPIPPGVTPLPTTAVGPTAVPGQCNTHLISPGETLSRIALTYNVTVQQIAQANNIVNPDLILAGDTLSIPCPVPATPGAPVATAVTGGTTTTGPFTYIVEPGDNLYRISLRYGVSMAALMQANGLTPATINQIYAGQQLYIPAAAVPAQQVVVTQPPVVTPLPTATLSPTG